MCCLQGTKHQLQQKLQKDATCGRLTFNNAGLRDSGVPVRFLKGVSWDVAVGLFALILSGF